MKSKKFNWYTVLLSTVILAIILTATAAVWLIVFNSWQKEIYTYHDNTIDIDIYYRQDTLLSKLSGTGGVWVCGYCEGFQFQWWLAGSGSYDWIGDVGVEVTSSTDGDIIIKLSDLESVKYYLYRITVHDKTMIIKEEPVPRHEPTGKVRHSAGFMHRYGQIKGSAALTHQI